MWRATYPTGGIIWHKKRNAPQMKTIIKTVLGRLLICLSYPNAESLPERLSPPFSWEIINLVPTEIFQLPIREIASVGLYRAVLEPTNENGFWYRGDRCTWDTESKNEGQAGIDLISKVSGNGKPTDIPLLATESIKELKKVNRLAGR